MPAPSSAYEGVGESVTSGVDESFCSETDAVGATAARLPRWRRGAAAALALCAAAALLAAAAAARRPPAAARRPAAALSEGAVALAEDAEEEAGEADGACSGAEEPCQDSKCCLDGGASGYQCFAKNDGWAQCLESCQKGPHEDETDGEYDQYGSFRKFEWSCEKLGKRSLKGCDAITNQTECADESSRCTWGSKGGKDACLVLCATLPAGDSCSSQENCMVNDGKCQPSCGVYAKEAKCPTDRCVWAGDQCMTACFAIDGEDVCGEAKWDRACVWKDDKCQKDPCSGGDENCLDTNCCSADRGADGKTCFKTDDNYGKCFELLEGCGTISNKTKCAADGDQCTWGSKGGKDACLIKCAMLPADEGCTAQEHCMLADGKCQPSCGIYGKEEKCPTDRCVWAGDKCMTSCPAIADQETCEGAMWDPRGCIWQGTCQKDPCSGGDENCLDTQCCSSMRGGMGKTCFQKDDNYGKCMELCEKSDDTEGWACKTLGNRTRWELGCSWIGHSCSDTGLCCQAGSACVVKDEQFTGCIQTQKRSTWDAQQIPIPSDWEGTTIGGSRDEYQMGAAGEGEDKADATLFCFMAYLPDSGEVPLRDVAKELGASIYGCDGYAEFESWSSEKKMWDTGDGGASITNTDVFLNVWEQVREHGGYMKADWTVKVDPDAVMVADRLKNHIYGLNAKKDMPIYLKNNGMDPGLGNNGFLGAIEVFSKRALQIYFDNWEGCKEAYGLDSGEDGFMKGCMDAMGVGFMTDADMFDPDFSPGACAHEERVAFHPLKEASQWRCCWDIIMGKTRDVKYGKCDMGPDGKSPPEPEYGGTAR